VQQIYLPWNTDPATWFHKRRASVRGDDCSVNLPIGKQTRPGRGVGFRDGGELPLMVSRAHSTGAV
jgi:hypothetical protein